MALKSGQTIRSLLNNGPCTCGKLYVGRTQWNLENRLQQDKNVIDCSLKHNQKPETFESAVAKHVFDFPHHDFLFDQTKIVVTSGGLLLKFQRNYRNKKKISIGVLGLIEMKRILG